MLHACCMKAVPEPSHHRCSDGRHRGLELRRSGIGSQTEQHDEVQGHHEGKCHCLTIPIRVACTSHEAAQERLHALMTALATVQAVKDAVESDSMQDDTKISINDPTYQ